MSQLINIVLHTSVKGSRMIIIRIDLLEKLYQKTGTDETGLVLCYRWFLHWREATT